MSELWLKFKGKNTDDVIPVNPDMQSRADHQLCLNFSNGEIK